MKQTVNDYQNIRQNMPNLPLKLLSFLQFQEYSIRRNTKNNHTNILCCLVTKSKTFDVLPQFANAYSTLSKIQQSRYYNQIMQFIDSYVNKRVRINEQNNSGQQNVQICKGKFNSWKGCGIRLDKKQLRIKVIQQQQQWVIELRDYLIRKSKKCRNTFVLLNIKQNINSKYKIRCKQNYEKCYEMVYEMMIKAHSQLVQQQLKQMMRIKINKSIITSSSNFYNMKSMQQSKKTNHTQTRIFVEDLFYYQQDNIIEKIQQQNQLIQNYLYQKHKNLSTHDTHSETLQHIYKKNTINISKKILPNHNISLPSKQSFTSIYTKSNFSLFQHKHRPLHYHLQLHTSNKSHSIHSILDLHNYHKWNSAVQISNLKINIPSENSQIIYQKHKRRTNKKPIDFLYLRHLFTEQNKTYIIQRSIENSNYPIFIECQRIGIEFGIWTIQEVINKNTFQIQILVSLEICYQNPKVYIQNLRQQLIQYLKNISQIEQYSKKCIHKVHPLLNMNWEYREQGKSNLLDKSSLFSQNLCSQFIQEQFYSVRQLSSQKLDSTLNKIPDCHKLQQLQKIQQRSSQQNLNTIQNIDEYGKFKINRQYLYKIHKSSTQIQKVPKFYKSTQSNHYLWKNIWQIPQNGGLKCKNQEILHKQHQIFFNLSKFYKNVSQNKSMFNITLPIQVHSYISILEISAASFGLAPLILEKIAILTNPLQRMKYAIVLNLNKTLLFLQIQKCFNSILGQTFQGWINGCPIYCQQISGRPQITSFFMEGRGYKIYGNIRLKVDLNINSAVGIDQGDCLIEFKNFPNQKIHLFSPGGEISGLLKGQRRFLLSGKSFYYDENNCLFGQIQFGVQSKKTLFNDIKHLDLMKGCIYQVRKDFISHFKQSDQKRSPKAQFIIKNLSQITGRWTESLFFDKVQYYDVNKDIPYILQKQKYPLASDCVYRQDINYRKMGDLVKSQIQKQRLESNQRKDRQIRHRRQQR